MAQSRAVVQSRAAFQQMVALRYLGQPFDHLMQEPIVLPVLRHLQAAWVTGLISAAAWLITAPVAGLPEWAPCPQSEANRHNSH